MMQVEVQPVALLFPVTPQREEVVNGSVAAHPQPETPSPPRDNWYYPKEVANDLKNVPLPHEFKREALACGWEYARCVIPQYTNWERYLAFVRVIIISIIAEFRGNLVDIAAGDNVLGYDVGEIIDTLFKGTPGHVAMGREFRAFLLLTAEKSSDRRDSILFRHYVDSLARSAKEWLRIRDTDALARFTIAAALSCNNFDDIGYNEEQMAMLAELGSVLYDAVAYHKHRAEGETHDTFAYAGGELRAESYRSYREVLWALDVAWAHRPEAQCVVNFIRFIGGPIHMMMRRYRFVEDGLLIGKPETEEVVEQTRQNFKLWNRVDATQQQAVGQARYRDVIAREKTLLFDGLADILESERHCNNCLFRDSYGAEVTGRFGGVELCGTCKAEWREYIETIPARTAAVFPDIKPVLENGF